jgi:hypothetical protein
MKNLSKFAAILFVTACISCAALPVVTIGSICTIGNEICSTESILCSLPLKLAKAKTSADSTAIAAKQDSLKLVLNGLAVQLQNATK